MKFLLVTTVVKNAVKFWTCQEMTPIGSLHPPVDLASIAATILSKGHKAKILDLRMYGDPLKEYKEEINRYNPDAVITNMTTTFAVQDYAMLKETPEGIKKIVFGTHSSALPEDCFQNEIDFVLLGDPEAGISELIINHLDGNKSKGVLTKESQTKPPFFLENLESLPFPALELLDLDKYSSPIIKEKRYSIVLSQRGCPFNCNFCFIPMYFTKNSRMRPVSNFVDELEHDVKKFGVKEFYFLDATFNFDYKRAIEVCKEIIKRNLKITWSCNMRVFPVNEELLAAMKNAGCRRIFYGVEDIDLLQDIKKGINKNQTIDAFRLTRKYGIKTMAFLMIFDRKDISEKEYVRKILELIKTLDTDEFQCNISIPFPGTEIFNQQYSQHKLSGDWSLYDPNTNKKLPYTSTLDLIQIKNKVYSQFVFKYPLKAFNAFKDMNFKGKIKIISSYIKYVKAVLQ